MHISRFQKEVYRLSNYLQPLDSMLLAVEKLFPPEKRQQNLI